ncbi:FeoC-like transcriptional regulator [Corynebacterium terpenotabidum]|uniref:Uncharacterized protein n=1 Tax=Corynebacterium terpenotabidum Y-11 TaxID=1200352 RepID=S4XE33_9CORY|nr:FeoC-like transcriptional regulator [Corynebacterium terpenotabidum]AGP31407.1 hypothetical protein A606_08830 [Corynebacterium terpenotabidum Y-11]
MSTPLNSPRSTPVTDVRDAIAAGATSRTDITRRTGLTPSTVDTAIEFLERTGRLRRERLASSCTAGSCSCCDLSRTSATGDPCCASHAGPERGPVALVLSPARRG